MSEVKIVHGQPSVEEIAAVVAVVAARAATAQAAEGGRGRSYSGWTDRASALRPLPAAGPGAWRAALRQG